MRIALEQTKKLKVYVRIILIKSIMRIFFNFIEAKNNDGSCPYKATYSTELCTKLLDIYAPIGSVVYDPFIGTGLLLYLV